MKTHLYCQVSKIENQSKPKSDGLHNVLRVDVSIWKFYRIGCTWMVSPWYASSCVFANYQIRCKHNYTGYIWMVSLLCASSSRELSNYQVECTNTRTMCICVAFHQSESSCAFSGDLIVLFYIRIDCNWTTFLQCASSYELAGCLIVLFFIRTDRNYMVFPQCASWHAI